MEIDNHEAVNDKIVLIKNFIEKIKSHMGTLLAPASVDELRNELLDEYRVKIRQYLADLIRDLLGDVKSEDELRNLVDERVNILESRLIDGLIYELTKKDKINLDNYFKLADLWTDYFLAMLPTCPALREEDFQFLSNECTPNDRELRIDEISQDLKLIHPISYEYLLQVCHVLMPGEGNHDVIKKCLSKVINTVLK